MPRSEDSAWALRSYRMSTMSGAPVRRALALPHLSPLDHFEKLLTEELHDSVCQSLAGTSLLVNVLQRQTAAGKPAKADDLQKVAAFLGRAMDDLRALISPDSLAAAGLGVALEKFAREMSQNFSCRLTVEAEAGVDEPRTALVLYRLARWAVRHAMKSSDAVTVELKRGDGTVKLQIHGTGAAAHGFRHLPADEVTFLRHYAKAAGIILTLNNSGRTLRARTLKS
jgi:signal transduction histidine kinase